MDFSIDYEYQVQSHSAFSCTQRNLDILVSVYMMNIRTLVSDY